MKILTKIADWWAARRRKIDLDILWPVCKERAPDLETARAIFWMHTCMDPAWLRLPEQERERQVWALT